ncbi:HAD-IA family hydrolase [Spongiimicrobium salis]|uniref:HAD-IA family hydrolase n=1 Tax=Spongiimicrobium salis TaxID=1667022 RepID=UPI00374DE0F8
MIKNIVFDFGDIFIDLDKAATAREMTPFGFTGITPQLQHILNTYEKGRISSDTFLQEMENQFPKANRKALRYAWNAIILMFPEYRLTYIEQLAKEKQYRLFLLSNTNALHIEKVIENMTEKRFERFKHCFEQFYLSHEIHYRKPDASIYEFVLRENQLLAQETFFVDDTKENTDAAAKLGIKTWNLAVGHEDIIELKSKL